MVHGRAKAEEHWREVARQHNDTFYGMPSGEAIGKLWKITIHLNGKQNQPRPKSLLRPQVDDTFAYATNEAEKEEARERKRNADEKRKASQESKAKTSNSSTLLSSDDLDELIAGVTELLKKDDEAIQPLLRVVTKMQTKARQSINSGVATSCLCFHLCLPWCLLYVLAYCWPCDGCLYRFFTWILPLMVQKSVDHVGCIKPYQYNGQRTMAINW